MNPIKNYEKSGASADEQSGIPLAVIEEFKKIAKKRNADLIFRLVNQFSTGLIESGASTKGLDVHAKSSDWGVQAGYIPANPELSKLYGASAVALNKAAGDVKHSLAEGYKSVQLLLSDDRIKFLQEAELIGAISEDGSVGGTSPGFSKYEFKVSPPENGKRGVTYREKGQGEFKPLTVIATKEGSPLTADIDMFAILPHLSNFSKPSKVAPDLFVDEKGNYISRRSAKSRASLQWSVAISGVKEALGQADRRHITGSLGYITKFEKDIRFDLNDAAMSLGNKTVIQHGTEQNNPFPENDKFVYVITAEGESYVYSRGSLPEFIHARKGDGYVFYENRKYARKDSLFYSSEGNVDVENPSSEPGADSSQEKGSSQLLLDGDYTAREQNADASAPNVKKKYQFRVILLTELDAVIEAGAKNLERAHPDTTLVFLRKENGDVVLYTGHLQRFMQLQEDGGAGSIKIDVIGHTVGEDGEGRLGTATGAEIVSAIKTISQQLNNPNIERVVAIGCNTSGSIVESIRTGLPKAYVTGTSTPIAIDHLGHKVPVAQGAPFALGQPVIANLPPAYTADGLPRVGLDQHSGIGAAVNQLLAWAATLPQTLGKAFVGYRAEADGKLLLIFSNLDEARAAPVIIPVDEPSKAQALREGLVIIDKAFVDLKAKLHQTSDFGGPDWLSTGLLAQALMHLANGFGDVPSYVKAQAYLGIAQGGVQVVGDVAETVLALRSLTAAAPGSRTLTALGTVLKNGVQAIGLITGGVSLGLDIKSLVDAVKSGDSAGVTSAGVQTGFSGGSLGLSAVSFLSGLLGASTVSAVTGSLAVPLAGLGIGIAALVNAFLRNDKTAARNFAFIHTINEAYSAPLKLVGDKEEAIMVTAGAPVKKIDFGSNTVAFSNVTIGGSEAAKSGHWWTPRPNDTDVLWVHNPVFAYGGQYKVGISRKDNVELWGVTGHEGAPVVTLAQELRDPSKALILMTMPELDADYTDYIRTNFNSDTLVDIIQKGSDAKVVLATNDHSAANWRYSSYPTTLEVVLDAQDRTLILPSRSEYEAQTLQTPGSNGSRSRTASPYDQSLVNYSLVGGGGNYVLALPADGTVRREVTISSHTAGESWSFHVSEGLALGGKKFSFSGPNKFSFNGQSISFNHHSGAAVVLVDDRIPQGYIALDVAKQTAIVSVPIGDWTPQLSPKELVDNVLKKLQPTGDSQSDILKLIEAADGRVSLIGKLDHDTKSTYFDRTEQAYSESISLTGYYDSKTGTAILKNDRKDRIFSYDGMSWEQIWDVGTLNAIGDLSMLDIFLSDPLTSGSTCWVMRNLRDHSVRKEIRLPAGIDFSRVTLTGTSDNGDRIVVKLPPLHVKGAEQLDVFKPGEPKRLTWLLGAVRWESSKEVKIFRHGQLTSVLLKWGDADGAQTVAWRNFGSDLNPFSEHSRERPSLFGTDLDEVLSADPKQIIALYGHSGNDKLIGSEGDDELYGGAGDDELHGNEGDDLLHAGEGVDIIDGGDGQDVVSFSGKKEDGSSDGDGVSVALRGANEATVDGADAQGDRIKNVESVIGTQFDDELYGDRNVNVLAGRAGEDWLNGGGGNDTLIGGAGNDIYDLHGPGLVSVYAEDNGNGVDTLLLNEVSVDDLTLSRFNDDLLIVGKNTATVLRDFFLDASKQRYRLAIADKIVTHEDFMDLVVRTHVDLRKKDAPASQSSTPEVLPYILDHMRNSQFEAIGNEGNDVIYGNEGGNRILGNAGHDILDGGEGGDTLLGGEGNDLLLGGADDDVLDGAGGENVLIGGEGKDTYVFDIEKAGRIIIVDTDSNINTLSIRSNTADPARRLSGGVYGADLVLRADKDPNRQVTIANYFGGRGGVVKDIEFIVSAYGQIYTSRQTMSEFLRDLPQLSTDLPGGPRRGWNTWGKLASDEGSKVEAADTPLLRRLVEAMSTFEEDASATPAPLDSETPGTVAPNKP